MRPHDISPTTITAEEARRLATSRASWLNLTPLRSLDPQVARELSRFRGDLYLDGLTDLTPDTAHFLALHEGGRLSLRGLRVLWPEVARALAIFKNRLLLDGLTTISEESCEALSLRTCGLRLNGLQTISASAAKALTQPMGWPLSLPRTAPLPDHAVRRFSQMTGKSLILDGIVQLEPEAEVALASHTGKLSLTSLSAIRTEALACKMSLDEGHSDARWLLHLPPHSLKTVISHASKKDPGDFGATLDASCFTALSKEVAEALACFEGSNLFLDGISHLGEDAADSLKLCRCAYLRLAGVKQLSDREAALLSEFSGKLSLPKLQSVDAETAKALSKCSGALCLDGLLVITDPSLSMKLIQSGTDDLFQYVEDISDEVAESLAECDWISLPSLRFLSLRAAKAFAECTGSVALSGLHEISDACASVMERFDGQLLDLGCPDVISATARTQLESNPAVRLETPAQAAARREQSDALLRKIIELNQCPRDA